MPFGGLLTAGIGAAASIGGAFISSHAAKSAAELQAESAQKGLDFQKHVYDTTQQQQAPFLAAGQTSIAQLMAGLSNGTFGPGSLPSIPTAPVAPDITFKPPTAEEARLTPGYEFTAQQGSKGILQGAAAAGGAISGGTLKALDAYNSGLAESTYGDTFTRALQTYNAALSGYSSKLAGYGASLAGIESARANQGQEFNQLAAPAQIGEGATVAAGNAATNTGTSIASLMGQIGNAQAAGTVGSANAINSGIGQAANSLTQGLLLKQLFGGGGTGKAAPTMATLASLGESLFGLKLDPKLMAQMARMKK